MSLDNNLFIYNWLNWSTISCWSYVIMVQTFIDTFAETRRYGFWNYTVHWYNTSMLVVTCGNEQLQLNGRCISGEIMMSESNGCSAAIHVTCIIYTPCSLCVWVCVYIDSMVWYVLNQNTIFVHLQVGCSCIT